MECFPLDGDGFPFWKHVVGQNRLGFKTAERPLKGESRTEGLKAGKTDSFIDSLAAIHCQRGSRSTCPALWGATVNSLQLQTAQGAKHPRREQKAVNQSTSQAADNVRLFSFIRTSRAKCEGSWKMQTSNSQPHRCL